MVATGCVSMRGALTRSMLRTPGDEDRHGYAEELVARAHEMHLSEADEWHRLGHYMPNLFGGYESQADGQNFFLAPHGKDDPSAELDATLRGFFADLAPYDPKLPDNRNIQHPICQFPARLRWLSEQLGIDATRLPPADCSRFEQFRDSLQAESITLVFSSYYLNNPASAFGHTFIRIRKKNDLVPEERRELLDFGIEFSADPDTTFAPLYAIKGMVGAFPGTFRRVPYYFKVRQYNDFESRDLWEYKLALTDDEREMLIAHTWELGSTYFDYFYLTENCSYHILGLIEAAVPRVHLLDNLHWPVIPADAVKALFDNPGFVASVTYRPSSRTKFRHEISRLSVAQNDAIDRVARDPSSKLAFDDRQAIQVLDAAQDLIDIRYAKELAHDDHTGPGAKLKQRLLERRAAILEPSPDAELVVPWDKMPQRGHDSRRIQLGGGDSIDNHPLAEFGARLALHDLADPTDGFPELSQLEFLPTRAHYDVDAKRFQLDQLDLVHVLSLTSQDRFDRHTSWEFRLGSERLSDAGCHCYAAHAQFGGGVAFATSGGTATIFALAGTHVWSGDGLDGIAGIPVRAGIGPGGGLRLRFSPRLVALSTGEWIWLPDQTGFATWWVSQIVRWEIVRDVALDFEARDQNDTATAVLSTMLYF
ncbi:MAG TPA: DUF4105 domain-containing protein [Kofleriaceae bacterium]|nr:DUF4105 domain-containing protein [Kofleriaceae bacterium]